MIIILIIIALFLILTIGFLVIPLTVVIDSRNKEYFFKLPGYFRLDFLLSDNYKIDYSLKIFFFKIRIKKEKFIKPRKIKDKRASTLKKNNLFKTTELVRDILKQIKLKKFKANIDTGDFPLNAQLIPIAQTANNKKTQININFQSVNDIYIKLDIRLLSLIYVIFKHKTLKK